MAGAATAVMMEGAVQAAVVKAAAVREATTEGAEMVAVVMAAAMGTDTRGEMAECAAGGVGGALEARGARVVLVGALGAH